MGRTQQDILVKIKALVEGLADVRELGKLVDKIQGGKLAPAGGGQTGALAGEFDRLAAAIDRLAAASEKADKSRGGFVRFLQGTAAVVGILSNIPQAFEGIKKLLDFADNVSGALSSLFGQAKNFFTGVGESISQAVGGAATRAGPALSGLGGAVSGLGGALAALAPAALAVGAALVVIIGYVAALSAGFLSLAASAGIGAVALTKVAQIGFEFQSKLEQVRLGIAGVITSLAELNVAGVPVEGAEEFRAAMALSADQLRKLQVDAVNTVATFAQIAPAFQAAIGPGLAAKLTLDQIRQITVKVVQAAAAIGLPLEQVNQEVRAILDGTINEDARLAKVLGISNEMVKSWKQQGTLAEELSKRLDGFSLAGVEAAQTMSGLTSNLQEALNVFSAEATRGAFAALKAEFARTLPQLFDFKNAGLQEQFKSLAALADDVLVRLIAIGGKVVQDIIGGVKRISEFVGRNRALIDSVLDQAGAMLRLLWEILKVFGNLATSSQTWGSTLVLVRSVLAVINGILAVTLAHLRTMAPLLQLLIVAANIATVGPFGGLGAGGASGGERFDLSKGLTDEQRTSGAAERARALAEAGLIGVGGGGRTKGAGGGKKGGGGGGRQSKVPELTRALDEAKIDLALARINAKADLARQQIESSIEAVQTGLEDYLVSIERAFDLQRTSADTLLRVELERIGAERKAARDRRDLAVRNLDKDLTPEERRLAIAAEDKKLTAEIIKLDKERQSVIEETLDKRAALFREEALAQEALERAVQDVQNQLDALSASGSVRAEAAKEQIAEQFRELRTQLVANFGEASEQVENLDRLIGRLGERVKFDELATDVGRAFERLRDEQARINDAVEQGQISAADGLKRRLELERRLQRHLGDTLAGLRAIAERTKDPELLAALRDLEREWGNLGKTIDQTAKRIDDTLRGGLEDTLVSIITRTESVGDAFRKLAQTILAEIARIVAADVVERFFGGVLRTNTGGSSIGGILGPILTGGRSNGTQGGGQSGGRGPGGTPVFNPQPFISLLTDFQSGALSGLGGVQASTDVVGKEVKGGFSQSVGLLGQQISLLGTVANATVQTAAAVVASAAVSIFKDLTAIFSSSAGAVAEGGHITGPGTGTSDSILARLSNGEFVLRAWATKMIGLPTLEYMNRVGAVPNVPAFALGGAVADVVAGLEPAALAGVPISVEVNASFPGVKDARSFKSSEPAIKRELSRASYEGVSRALGRRGG